MFPMKIKDLSKFRRLPYPKIIENLDYYDGPLSGICQISNKLYYFDLFDINEKYCRYYLVFKVSKDDLALLKQNPRRQDVSLNESTVKGWFRD